MTQHADKTLRFDLSSNTPEEISDFFASVLVAKRKLARSGLQIHICPKTRRIILNKDTQDESDLLDFTTVD